MIGNNKSKIEILILKIIETELKIEKMFWKNEQKKGTLFLKNSQKPEKKKKVEKNGWEIEKRQGNHRINERGSII